MTAAWIAIYISVPALMLILLAVQARTPGADPPRSASLPAWLYVCWPPRRPSCSASAQRCSRRPGRGAAVALAS